MGTCGAPLGTSEFVDHYKRGRGFQLPVPAKCGNLDMDRLVETGQWTSDFRRENCGQTVGWQDGRPRYVLRWGSKKRSYWCEYPLSRPGRLVESLFCGVLGCEILAFGQPRTPLLRLICNGDMRAQRGLGTPAFS